MRRRAALGLGLAAAIAAILFLFRDADEPESPAAPRRTGAPESAPEAPGPAPGPRTIEEPGRRPAEPPRAGTGGSLPEEAAPRPVLRGRVYTADGRPAARATLTLVAPGASEGKPPSTSAGAGGEFEFAIERSAKGYRIDAAHAPSGESAEHRLDVVDLSQIAEVEIHLQAKPTLEGRVLDPGGAGVPGASVRLVRLAPLELGSWSPDSTAGVATTDAGGRYRLVDLTPGPARLVVHAEGFPARWVDLAIDEDPRRVLDVDLAAGTSIAGTVTDRSGAPIAGAVVRLERAKTAPGDPGEERHARTDASGRWRIDGIDPERWYRVEVFDPGSGRTWSPEEPVQGSAGAVETRVD